MTPLWATLDFSDLFGTTESHIFQTVLAKMNIQILSNHFYKENSEHLANIHIPNFWTYIYELFDISIILESSYRPEQYLTGQIRKGQRRKRRNNC